MSFYTNALEPDEMLTWISVPAIRPDQGWGFVEYAHQHGDYGLAGAGALLTMRADGSDRSQCGPPCSAPPTGRCCSSATMRWARSRRPASGRNSPSPGRRSTEPVGDDADYSRRLCAAALAEALAAAHRRVTIGEEQASDGS